MANQPPHGFRGRSKRPASRDSEDELDTSQAESSTPSTSLRAVVTRGKSPSFRGRGKSPRHEEVGRPTNTSPTEFQFLTFNTLDESKNSAARRTVRSHVTRQQHQRAQLAAASKQAQESQETLVSQEQDRQPQSLPTSRATTPVPQLALARASSSPDVTAMPHVPGTITQQMNSGQIGSFRDSPSDWTPFVSTIIDHYRKNLALDDPFIDGPVARGLLRTRWLPLAITEEASFYATLLFAASHYEITQRSQEYNVNLLGLKGKAIEAINEALADPVRSTSDSSIGAVATLASYEAMCGNVDVFQMHVAGLQKMVRLRGGLASLGLDGLLERALLCFDSLTARMFATPLCFDPVQFPTQIAHPAPDSLSYAVFLRLRRQT
ncbi:hypothetical protein LTR66_001847 [Elasticomyces elasticus]|nr:hypothetical protein LTR50_005981 [Elasticomyces elasticus]KAK4999039.1 hypothetical protein LTR66_001847 [Elasticomyces elasticus]